MSQISIRFRQTLNPLWVLSFPSVHLLLTRSYEKINGVATMRRCPCGKHVFKTRYVYKPPMPKPPLFLDSKRKPLVVLILSNHYSTSNFKHQPGTKKHRNTSQLQCGPVWRKAHIGSQESIENLRGEWIRHVTPGWKNCPTCFDRWILNAWGITTSQIRGIDVSKGFFNHQLIRLEILV